MNEINRTADAEMKPWYDGIEEKVVEAYKAKGLKPSKWTWYSERCCALGALHHERLKTVNICSFEEMDTFNNSPTGDSAQFAFGFDAGLDDDRRLSKARSGDRPPAWYAGYRSARAVINAGLV